MPVLPQYATIAAWLAGHAPRDAQEVEDIACLRRYMETFDDLLVRDNTALHFTASSLIVDKTGTQTLLCWHNIYKSWSWTGGHADGEADLLAVAVREAREETGAVCTGGRLLGVDILPVAAHRKKGRPVAAHLHLNFCFLLQADSTAPLAANPEENSGVAWFALHRLPEVCTEPDMVPVYRRLLSAL